MTRSFLLVSWEINFINTIGSDPYLTPSVFYAYNGVAGRRLELEI